MKIIVASFNPVKINAAKAAFELAFPDESIEVAGSSVLSGVGEQPMSSQETKTGSFNRATNAKIAFPDADYWIGLEGGVDIIDDKMMTVGWVTILDNSKIGQARTASFILPDKLRHLIESGIELGKADDIVFQKKDSNRQNGAVGILTRDLIDRTQAFTNSTILALIPFMNPDLY